MRKNNYNTNANGPDIELTCFYDCDRSRWEFEENFKILEYSGYRTFTKAYYIDNGNVPDNDEIEFRLKGTLEQKTEFLKKEGYSDDDMPQPEYMDDYILDTYGERISLLNYQDFNIQYDPLYLVPSKQIEWIAIRGYSQGDYAEVVYCPDDLEKVWGNPPKKDDLKKWFTRYFYDAPIFCLFEIDGEEYRYDEFMDDSYDWDPEKFAKIVSEKSGIDLETLKSFLPRYPDYN